MYLAGAGLQCAGVLRRRVPPLALLRGIALGAVIAHSILVWQLVFAEGLNLGLFRVTALVTLTMVVIILLSSFNRPLENLFIVLFPVAALSVAGALLLNSSYLPATAPGIGFIAHLVLSVFAFSVLFVAVCQSLMVSWQEQTLRRKAHVSLTLWLPPLQVMEHLLFSLLRIGLILLSLTIISGFAFLQDMFAQRVVHHTVLSLSSWVVFAILLWGRHYRGWRGRTARNWTVGGIILLMLAYFGSKFVIEVILAN